MVAVWPLLVPFSGTFNGRVSLCYHPPSLPNTLPAWQLSQTLLLLPSGAQRTERPGWENSNIDNIFFFSFSVHRLIFQEGLSLLYGKAERGIESKVGVGCRGVGGCGDMGLQCKSLLTFSIFFFLTDHFHAGYQGVWPIIGMQIAADGVPQQKKRTG